MKRPSNYELSQLASSLGYLGSVSDTEILLQGWMRFDASVSKVGWLRDLEYLPWLCTWIDERLAPSISYENPSIEDVTDRALISGALQTAVRILELNRLSADQIRPEMFTDIRPGLTQLCSVICLAVADSSKETSGAE